MIARTTRFFGHELWQLDLAHERGWRGLGLAALRIVIHVLRAFFADLGSLRAAGLTLVTLLALVPMLALASGVANGFGYGDVLDEKLVTWGHSMPETLQPLLEQVRSVVARTSFGALGVIGSLLLAYSAMLLFVRIEQALNRIWRVGRGRSWYRRITDFIALVVLFPPLVLAAVALQSLLNSADWLQGVVWLEWIYRAGLGVVPHLLLWIAFTALYKLMPSARVRWGAAAIAGMVAGSGLLFTYGFYLSAQISVVQLNAIYGTLAALPLLLVYLQVTWTIVLFGAEVSYAVQHRHELRGPVPEAEASPAAKLRLALLLTNEVCATFARGEGSTDLAVLGRRLGVPPEWIEVVYADLQRGGVLGQLADDDGTEAVPLRAPEQIAIGDVVQALLGRVSDEERQRLVLPPELDRRLAELDRVVEENLGRGGFGGGKPGGGP